ncbi:MFS transporter [Nostoc sp. FACHB-87]|uniref:MFS transporter n=1 Tax=Nostocales TaxID=1161 RepID=UPI0016837608|nr:MULTISPECIES: MFS transporter [Nostocales]MBD2453324.1 MFS transporter [Nostoc sp. FACHB-87]MBD2475448.1 MFS transporter [Anabaena sp. FACHB-83]MBD2490220.1 MFS transporter [Aulosira sp. FACHB-615]
MNTFNAELRRNLLILFAAGLLFWSSTAAFLPTLPLYIQDVGGSKQEIGIVMGGFAIGLLLFRPMLGKLADQRGRKLVLLIGLTVAAIAPFGYLVFTSIPILFFLRVFHGISIAAFTTGFSALVADLAPVAIRGEIIGYMSLTAPVGLAIGPALGGYLQASFGYSPLFLFTAVVAVIGLLCASQVINPPVNTQPQSERQNSNFWQILVSPRVRIPALVMLLVGSSVGAVHVFVSLFIKSTEVNFNGGWFFTVAAISSFTIRVFAGKASDRFGRGLFITFGIAAYTLACALLWQANSTNAFLISAIAEGCGGGTMISMIVTMMADRSLPQERGQVFAICMAGFDLGIAIAAPIFGYLSEFFGYRNMFGYSAVLTFLALLIFLTLSNKSLTGSLRFAIGNGEDAFSLNNVDVS